MPVQVRGAVALKEVEPQYQPSWEDRDPRAAIEDLEVCREVEVKGDSRSLEELPA